MKLNITLPTEITVGHLRGIQKLILDDPQEFQYQLAKRCFIKEDGQPIGDELDNMSIEQYLELTESLMLVFGKDAVPAEEE